MQETCLQWFANNKVAEQPAHPRRLIRVFVIRFLESIISKLDPDENSCALSHYGRKYSISFMKFHPLIKLWL